MKRARSENRKAAALWLLAAACLLLSPGAAEAGKKAKSKWAKKEPKVSVQPAKPKPQADMSASAGSASAGVVNVNKATIPELCLLPGIGPKRAGQIVALRSKKPFKSPKELLKIKGIGRKTLKKLLPYIAVAGETTLKAPVSGL
jgi:competence protein ComEA